MTIHKSVSKPDSHITNGFQLVNRLSDKYIDDNFELISLDVISLFINVPLDLAIDSVSRRWNHIGKNGPLPQDEFLSAFSALFFSFNSFYYQQTFDIPMSSLISPIIDDIILEDLELKALEILSVIPSFYFRYVDDIALAIPSSSPWNF